MMHALKNIFKTPWQRTLYIMFFAQMTTAVGFSSIFPFLPLYVKELGASSGLSIEFLIGMVFSSHAMTMMVASPIWGAIADRFGRKLMVERAMFGGAVFVALMAFARSAEELVILRAIQGLITGVIGASSALVAAVVPRDRTGYAMGMLQVSLGVGVALGPLIGGVVADWLGYRAAFYVTSVMLCFAGIIVFWGVEENFSSSQKPGSKSRGILAGWRQILLSQGVVVAYGLRFMSQLGRMMIYPILPLFVQMLLADTARMNTFTGVVIGVGSATTTVGAIYLGRLGDRIGHRRIVIVSSIAAALLYLTQGLVVTGWQLLLLQALVGIALGGVIPSISALLARYTTHGVEGAVFGLDNAINSGARAIAPLLAVGVALEFGLRTTFAAIGLLFVIAALLAAWRLPSVQKSDL